MSWTLSFTDPTTSVTKTAVLPNPDYGDRLSKERRQAKFRTDGGRDYVQDYGFTFQTVVVRWSRLNAEQRGRLEKFLEVVRYQARPFKLTITAASGRPNMWPVKLKCGAVKCGEVVCPTNAVVKCGQTLDHATVVYPRVTLEEPRLQLVQPIDGYSDSQLNLRLHDPYGWEELV